MRSGLPRPRGDGPSSRVSMRASSLAPPPTRGWTAARARRTERGGGSPAHAGMDRGRLRWRRRTRRLPRPRGDGPVGGDTDRGWRTAPPPTRGWTRRRRRAMADLRGSPAHAGMDLPYRVHSHAHGGLPRPRGDGPSRSPTSCPARGAPPPTRGWTVGALVGGRPSVGSPAHAGMDPGRSCCWPRSPGLPRPRGDGPEHQCCPGRPPMAPPPTRGWTRGRHVVVVEDQGSPAHAGMDPVGCHHHPP